MPHTMTATAAAATRRQSQSTPTTADQLPALLRACADLLEAGSAARPPRPPEDRRARLHEARAALRRGFWVEAGCCRSIVNLILDADEGAVVSLSDAEGEPMDFDADWGLPYYRDGAGTARVAGPVLVRCL